MHSENRSKTIYTQPKGAFYYGNAPFDDALPCRGISSWSFAMTVSQNGLRSAFREREVRKTPCFMHPGPMLGSSGLGVSKINCLHMACSLHSWLFEIALCSHAPFHHDRDIAPRR